MSTVGRAAFRAVHAKVGGRFPDGAKNGGSTRAIYEEALRATDPALSVREAGKNANIIVSQERLNRDFVNDGNGGLRSATSTAVDDVEAYLASRNAMLFRKQGHNDAELSELVVHLPENLCVEDPDPTHRAFVLDDDGRPVISATTGEPLTKPRTIPRDMDEARRYFDDAQDALVKRGVILGGVAAIHARSDQFSEHRPHMQMVFDNYAPDPKHPGKLRNEFSRTWFSHRDVVYPPGHPKAGKVIGGKVKLSLYQEALREEMIARGWPVERDIDCDNEGVHRGKKSHTRNDDLRLIAEDRLAAAEVLAASGEALSVQAAESIAQADFDRTVDADAAEVEEFALNCRSRRLDDRERDVDDKHRELASDRRQMAVERRKAQEAIEAARARERAAQRVQALANDKAADADEAFARYSTSRDVFEAFPPVFERFLDQPFKDGKTLRPAFEKFERKYNGAVAQRAFERGDAGSGTSTRTRSRDDGDDVASARQG